MGGALEANWSSVIEIIVDGETDASMGPGLDKIVDYESLPFEVEVLATAGKE